MTPELNNRRSLKSRAAGRTRFIWAGCRRLAIFLFLTAGLSPSSGATDPIRLLVLGDSLTAGYGLSRPDAFPTKLEAALNAAGLNVTVINSGVSGDTTAGGRARLAWALGDKPDAVIVELGANDGLRGIDPAETRANLADILARAKGSGAKVMLAGMKAPPNLGRDYGGEFNRIFPELAKQFNIALYPFFLEGVAARPNLNQADGIHPNAAGVDEIVQRMLPDVMAMLADLKS